MRSAAVIGGGPAGLMAAEVLAAGGAAVTVYDRMPTLGRKLLMAGRGGLNLTHSEPAGAFLARYRPAEGPVRAAIQRFTPADLRAWCAALGQDTFVGSSGRVFPTAMKASPLLRAWLRRLAGQGVAVAPRHRWLGWHSDGSVGFETPDGPVALRPAATVLALGGASWPWLGADGAWASAFPNVAIAPLRPANCGVAVPWSAVFRERHEGAPLKNVALRFGSREARGDVVVTRNGLEGGAVYALASDLRDALDAGPVTLAIDLRPDLPTATLVQKLGSRDPRQSLATALKKRLHLAPAAIGLLHEAALAEARPLSGRTAAQIADLIRAVPVRLTGTTGLDRAISTAGGLRSAALDGRFMLRDRPGTFAAGEMLDWDAPTGGYLLQGCFATGAAAGAAALAWLQRADDAVDFGRPEVRFSERQDSTGNHARPASILPQGAAVPGSLAPDSSSAASGFDGPLEEAEETGRL